MYHLWAPRLEKHTKQLQTFEYWGDLENSQASNRKHLSHSQLHEEHWNASKNKREEVRNEEGSSSILVAEVREPPDIAQTDSETDYGEDEVQLAPPGTSLR